MRRWATLLAVGGIIGCLDAGSNQNQQAPGNGDGGVDVGIGDLAIDPTGRYVFYTAGERLLYVDLGSGTRHQVPGIEKPQRFAFGPAGSGVVYAVGGELADEPRGTLVAYDVGRRRERWSRPVALGVAVESNGFAVLPWLDPTADGRSLVVTHTKRVEVLDAAGGSVRQELATEQPISDVDLVPGGDRVLLTEIHRWEDGAPVARVHSLGLTRGEVASFEVPNCASELVLTPDGRHGFLAPTTCRRDPVSVIDVAGNRFLRNLPGFGPVEVAPGGMLAVAFLDARAADAALFDDPSQIPPPDGVRYHLMLIDTATLGFRTVPLGDSLPRYALTPDGHVLLVDSPAWIMDDGRLRLLDVWSGELRELSGDVDVRLESFVVTSDATRVFLIDGGGLWRVDVADGRLVRIPLDFTPRNLNITPDDRRLLLREDDDTLWLYDVERGRIEGRVEIRPAA